MIAEKMKNDGLAIDFEEIKAKNPSGCIGRPHFAEYLVEKKLVKTRQQAFDKYLGKGRPYYVERTGADLKEAIFAIKTSGGIRRIKICSVLPVREERWKVMYLLSVQDFRIPSGNWWQRFMRTSEPAVPVRLQSIPALTMVCAAFCSVMLFIAVHSRTAHGLR